MHIIRVVYAAIVLASAIVAGCEGEGPAIEARPQTIGLVVAAEPAVGEDTTLVSATASSGLPVQFTSLTPALCTVDSYMGLVTSLASGTCTIAANQSGDTRYAPAPQVTRNITFILSHSLVFAPPPVMYLYDQAIVTAVDSSGLKVSYVSSTPAVCSVSADTGLVTANGTGDCTIVAVAGDGDGAIEAAQTITIAAPYVATAPGMPTGVTASAGDTPNSVLVHVGATDSGGSTLTGYVVASSPPGLSATAATSPITVVCPSSCTGYAFSVTAVNAIGASPPSALAEVITDYDVVETFFEPDTQPNNSVFVGSFTFNATHGTVTNLRGRLSESMTGGAKAYPDDTMIWLPLDHQLSALPVTLGGVDGLLVTTFLLSTTDTLSNNPKFAGSDGWSPGTGYGLYYGYPTPGANPGNAYARIFVGTADPTAALTKEQIDMLAYADCAPGGMMGSICMTGTTVAGYGRVGTMSGYPVSQVITRR